MTTRTTVTDLKDINLGDVLEIDNDCYGHCTVYRKNKDGSIQVTRPYIKCNDFEYTGGVMTYIGHEDFAIHSGPVTRVRVGQPLK